MRMRRILRHRVSDGLLRWVAHDHAELECLLGDFGDRINEKGRADLAPPLGTKGRGGL